MSFKSILVPLDWSMFAESALPVGLRLAQAAGARLRIVMAHEPTMAPVPAAELPAMAGPDEVAVREAQQSYLAGVASDLGAVNGHPVEVSLIEGVAGPALVELIERTSPDLVAMATHGRGPLSRLWLGSVADHVIRHTSVPVLLIRPTADGEVEGTDRISSVLVPLDRSSESEAILGPVTDLATLTGASVTLVHVVEPVLGVSESLAPYPTTAPKEITDVLRAEAETYLAEIASRLGAAGVRVSIKVVSGMGVAGTLLAEADQGGFDMVAMSTHGAGGVRRLLLGSVTDKVVRGSTRPIMVLRPAGPVPG